LARFSKALILPMSVSIVFSVMFSLVIQIPVFLLVASATHQSCLFVPWYLIFKNPYFFMELAFVALLLSSISDKLHGIFSLSDYKRLTKISFKMVHIVSLLVSIFLMYFYGNLGAGACLKPNVNINYYKYPGQEKYLE